MSSSLKAKVDELLHNQVTYVPVSESLIANAKVAYQELMNLLAPVAARTHFTRPGEIDADLGLLERRGAAGSDIKDFFHYAHDLSVHLRADLGEVFYTAKPHLVTMGLLYEELQKLSIQLAEGIDEHYAQYFSVRLVPAVSNAARSSLPYSTTTLRGLRYPAIVGPVGAKTHIDRSLFSIHCGDEGGHLRALNSEKGNVITPIKVPEGQVAIFRGVKMWLLSRGKYEPVWHNSTTVFGKPRLALVQFVQADVPGMYVHKAREVYETMNYK
jgi:hypothetical protein